MRTKILRCTSVMLALFTVGCFAVGDIRLTSLEEEQRQHEERLELLKREIAEAEEEAFAARQRAEIEQCKAKIASIDAEVALRVAKCSEEQATYYACTAQKEKKKSDSTLAGCGLGLAAALLSGGSLAPFVLAGCGGGRLYSEATASTCSAPPACEQEASGWVQTAYWSAGFKGVPLCGVGIEVGVELSYVAGGVMVTSIIPGTGASRANLAVGDIIIGVNGWNVLSSGDISQALSGVQEGARVSVDVIRGGIYGVVLVDVSLASSGSAFLGQPILGVQTIGYPAMEYQFLRVTHVSSGSVGEAVGFQAGDMLVGFDEKLVVSPLRMIDITTASPRTMSWLVARDKKLIRLQSSK